MTLKKNVSQFNSDIEKYNGYLYTQKSRLSCKFANDRISKAVFGLAEFAGKRVIDIGCGDGTYTFELLQVRPDFVLGVDAASLAVDAANSKVCSNDNIKFEVYNIYNLDPSIGHFDIAVVRGLIHHLPDAKIAIQKIIPLADTIIIVEPNGYNPILKIIERTSRYHIIHEEKSYSPRVLDRWCTEAGGSVEVSKFYGLVPMFCPDWFARILKVLEPVFEVVPIMNRVSCAVNVKKITSNRV